MIDSTFVWLRQVALLSCGFVVCEPKSCAPTKQCTWSQAMNPKRREVLVQCLALKMLTDFTLMYSSCVGVLLKRDGEIAAKESGAKTPGKGAQTGAGALFK